MGMGSTGQREGVNVSENSGGDRGRRKDSEKAAGVEDDIKSGSESVRELGQGG